MMQMFSNIAQRSAALEQYRARQTRPQRRAERRTLRRDHRPLQSHQSRRPRPAHPALLRRCPGAGSRPHHHPSLAARMRSPGSKAAWPTPPAAIITLVGMPGSGKSRLAMEVATRYSSYFPDGVKFYRMEEVKDPAACPATWPTACGVDLPISLDPLPALCNLLTPLNILLVLDGFEHLVGATEMLLEMLRRAERLELPHHHPPPPGLPVRLSHRAGRPALSPRQGRSPRTVPPSTVPQPRHPRPNRLPARRRRSHPSDPHLPPGRWPPHRPRSRCRRPCAITALRQKSPTCSKNPPPAWPSASKMSPTAIAACAI